MNRMNSRSTDNNFELNLAPVLDIIVSVVSLLLLSATFMEVKIIETPVPQVVEKLIENLQKEKQVEITVKMSKQSGFVIVVDNKGKKTETNVPMLDGKLNFVNLHQKAMAVKQANPAVFGIQIEPEKNLALDDIIATMDQLRKMTEQKSVEIKDPQTGEMVKTDLMFPNVAFANVLGDK